MNQGLCGLGEGVGDAVAETLSQTGPAKTAAGVGAQGRCCSCQPRDRFYLPLRQRQDTVPGFLCEPSPQSPCSASGPGLRVALYLFWMDLDSQPLCPTIWVMFLASHQALLSGKRASLLMGGGAARSSAGNRAPTTNHNIMASSAKILHLHTERKMLAAKKPGQAAHFSYPEEVLGRSKHRSVPTSPPQAAPRTLPREWDVLLCLLPLPKMLWASQTPVSPLPVPGTAAGFSSFPTTQSWARRSLQTKSVTATSRARLEKSHTTEMFLFEEGTSFPVLSSPTLKAKSWPCWGPSPPGMRSRCRCKAAAMQAHVETSAQGCKPAGKNNTTLIYTEPPEFCKGLFQGWELGLQTRGVLVTRTNLAR